MGPAVTLTVCLDIALRHVPGLGPAVNTARRKFIHLHSHRSFMIGGANITCHQLYCHLRIRSKKWFLQTIWSTVSPRSSNSTVVLTRQVCSVYAESLISRNCIYPCQKLLHKNVILFLAWMHDFLRKAIDEFQIDPVRALPHWNRGSLCQVTNRCEVDNRTTHALIIQRMRQHWEPRYQTRKCADRR